MIEYENHTKDSCGSSELVITTHQFCFYSDKKLLRRN